MVRTNFELAKEKLEAATQVCLCSWACSDAILHTESLYKKESQFEARRVIQATKIYCLKESFLLALVVIILGEKWKQAFNWYWYWTLDEKNWRVREGASPAREKSWEKLGTHRAEKFKTLKQISLDVLRIYSNSFEIWTWSFKFVSIVTHASSADEN